jgi:hypothetical protein
MKSYYLSFFSITFFFFMLSGCDPSGDGFMAEISTRSAAEHGKRNRNIHQLVPERYADTLDLNQVIKDIKSESNLNKLAQALREQIKESMGIEPLLPDLKQLKNKPELLANLLQFRLDEIDKGREKIVSQNLYPQKPALEPHLLPSPFDYGTFHELAFQRPAGELKELVPGKVYQGWPQDRALADEQCKANMILAEVFERLSDNLVTTTGEKFTVIFNGRSYQDFYDFIQALVGSGHQITAKIRHTVANFLGLHGKDPQGNLRPIAAAAFSRTEFLDAQRNEAVLPMSHSEIAFFVSPQKVANGTTIEAAAVFYQGVERIGFYGEACQRRDPWVGHQVTDSYGPQEAPYALELVGVFNDVIRMAAEKKGLGLHGYGVLGVCNDSVAVIQKLSLVWIASYPLFMLDQLILPELEERLIQGRNIEEKKRYLDRYREIKGAIQATPSDARANETTRQRALQSIPWKPGQEPFYSTIEARRILLNQ